MEDSKSIFDALLATHKDCTIYQLDKYLFLFPTNLLRETYSCKDYNGIIFETEDCKYDVCNNYLLGFRLIINPKAGGFSDIPFKPTTFGLLPASITVKEIG